jgi:glycosyltransferase involved in cell wall biosynthesis
MTNYNKGSYVREAIQSILLQTFTDFELIIIDDGSSDDSPSIIAELQRADPRIVYVNRQHMGPSSARNFAIEQSRGKLIAFMDSDDTCTKDKLSKQVELFATGENFICYTDGWIMNQAGTPTGKIFNQDLERIPENGRDGYIFKFLLRRNYIIDSSVMMPKEILLNEKFDERLTIGYDTDLWVRLSRRIPFRYVPEPLYGYRIYEGNTWSKRNQERILRNHILMYHKWLRIFNDLEEKDLKVIMKYMWKSYAQLRDWPGLMKFTISDRRAFAYFISKTKSSISYRLRRLFGRNASQ